MAKDPYKPQIVVKNGKPVSVLLDIGDYEALLEIAEQKEDMKAIRAMKRRDWKTISFDEYLQRNQRRVSARNHSRGATATRSFAVIDRDSHSLRDRQTCPESPAAGGAQDG